MTFIPLFTPSLADCLNGVAVLGCMQAFAGAAVVGSFAKHVRARRATTTSAATTSAALPPISVLKPLHGDEPLLEQALRSFLAQDYPNVQIVFGVQDAADDAIAVVRRLHQEFPLHDLRLVVDTTAHGPNRKVANLINMLPYASHELLVISDSDIHVAPDYLRAVAGCFAATPGAALVTTLYCGLPASLSLTRRLAAGYVNHSFLPGVLLSRLLGRQDCLGSTMALQRRTLEAIGGLERLSAHVADDHTLGQLVRRQGGTIEIAPILTATTISDTGASDLFAHELRWGRTIRAVAPLGYVLSAVQFPLFWASLALIASPAVLWSWLLFALIWTLRAASVARIDHAIVALGGHAVLGRARTLLLLPLRDWISAIVMAASFAGNRVRWRGQVLLVSEPRQPVPARPMLASQTFVQGD
ncbi:bacteriohopanetetrol glucosamine biosynthesis glycosyltransferase HpnI [Lichenicoccus sp.]|uniref:bacteriohopanetetrol glucosamine biosynthesis glycosyltransferase HpnI n=1 Tax=Lichenicoccus sp. TaxID=2781899 RepID=UPI003D0AA94C